MSVVRTFVCIRYYGLQPLGQFAEVVSEDLHDVCECCSSL